MCGIFGVARRTPATPEKLHRALAACARALAHRGPDGAAMWNDQHAALGLTRLGIVRPKEAARVYSAGEVHSVMNGEIYNHVALREGLMERGVVLTDETDAALVPHLHAAYGIDFVQRIDGPFAIAVYDGARRALRLYRDRLGKKPLFYVTNDDGVAFASEIKALFAADWAEKRPRASAAAHFIATGVCRDDEPLWEDIASLPAGHVLTVGGRGSELRPMWKLDEFEGALSQGDALPQAERLMRAAIKDRNAAEVESAVLLSGGLDSSLLAALARDHIDLAYTIRVPGYDEAAKASAVAEHLGLRLRVVDAEPPTWGALERSLWHLERPDARSAYAMAGAFLGLADRLAADGVRVALSGEGADELFLGYPWDRAEAAAVNGWPAPHDVVQRLGENGPTLLTLLRMRERMRGAEPTALACWLAAHDGDYSEYAHDRGMLLLRPELRPTMATPRRAVAMPRTARARQRDGLGRDMLSLPVLHADRLFMAAGVEARMPFLDHRLVELALSLEPAALEAPDVDKPFLRHLAARMIAPPLPMPPKQGFTARAAPEVPDLLDTATGLTRDPGLGVDSARLREAIGQAPTDRNALRAVWRAVLLETTLRVFAGAGDHVNLAYSSR